MTPARRILNILPALFVSILFLVPALAHASGDAPAAHMTMGDILWDLGVKALNVGILGFLILKYLSGPLNKIVETRSAKVRAQIEAADGARREAEERLNTFRKKAALVNREIEELRTNTSEDIEREQKLLLEEARQAAEHIRQQARDTIRQEVLKARDDLHREAARLAARTAEEIIRNNINPGDHDRLTSEYMKEMEAAK